jgi:hypothetical protein
MRLHAFAAVLTLLTLLLKGVPAAAMGIGKEGGAGCA